MYRENSTDLPADRTAGKSADRPTDLRVLRTRRAIEQALCTLLGRTRIEKITIADICAEALVTRGTFYRHYHDKYEVATSIATRELARLRDQVVGSAQHLAQGKPGARTDGQTDARGDSPMEALIPLRTFLVGGRTVEDRVREIVTDALELVSQADMLREDLETEAWALTMLAFEYQRFRRTTGSSVSVDGYAHAIAEAAVIYQRTFEGDPRAW